MNTIEFKQFGVLMKNLRQKDKCVEIFKNFNFKNQEVGNQMFVQYKF